MNDSITTQSVEGSWLHSHEEDTATATVYRPASFDFPASRGRSGFTLLPDGTSLQQGIAPADGYIQTGGVWELNHNGSEEQLHLKPEVGPTKKMTIISVSPDRLVVKNV